MNHEGMDIGDETWNGQRTGATDFAGSGGVNDDEFDQILEGGSDHTFISYPVIFQFL